jgi:hypothetical protein
MKTREAVAALEALGRISHGKKPVPVKFAYAAVRNKRKLTEAVQAFELAQRSLLQQHGAKDTDGQLEKDPATGGTLLRKIDKDGNIVHDGVAPFEAAMKELLEVDLGEITLHAVAFDEFPEAIDLAAMEALAPMLLEEQPVKVDKP